MITLISVALISFTIYRFYLKEKKKRRKLLSQKKSSEVLLGQISEHLAPFLDSFPVEDDQLNGINFLGMPIDYIHFGKDKVTFIEVKSGNSRLSKKQRKIRDLIKEGKVEFKTHRIK